MLSLPINAPRLFLSARSIASLNERGNTSLVALPSGTLLVNGLWPVGADGRVTELEYETPLSFEDSAELVDAEFWGPPPSPCPWHTALSASNKKAARSGFPCSLFIPIEFIKLRFSMQGKGAL
jgi:hypothetical protein